MTLAPCFGSLTLSCQLPQLAIRAAFNATRAGVQAALRKMIIELVLATDMQKHVAVHTALQTRLAVMQAAERAPSEVCSVLMTCG